MAVLDEENSARGYLGLTYEIALLMSRDADFVGVINIIKDLGCNVELVLFEDSKSHAQELSKHVDDIQLITKSEYSSCEK